jgi:uncharacterized protein (TIRG00374 family)
MKKFAIKFGPWIITAVALYLAFRDIHIFDLMDRILTGDPTWLLLALCLTISSYLFRSRRWQFLFPKVIIEYADSLRVLVLGFFMNNILPARTGELVRAHLGAQATNQKRTLVLATIASERLLDGLALSFLFVLFAIQSGQQEVKSLLIVAAVFGAAAIGVVLMLWKRSMVFELIDRVNTKFNSKTADFTTDRIQVFINGLLPLLTRKKLPVITLWTAAIWLTELLVFISVSKAYDAGLSLSLAVMFLTSVNFSSLIPAAPGGIGVIEAAAAAVLVALGIEKEIALSMIISQHFIQYLVIGISGSSIMLFWKKPLPDLEEPVHEQAESA